MNSKFSKFQLITLSVFVIFIIVGVGAFAFYKGGSNSSTLPAITIWGTIPKLKFDQYVSTISNNSSMQINVTYVEKTQAQFTLDFISALARGQGPDVILVPIELVLPNEDKLALIPYSSMSQYAFKQIYVQEADVYLNSKGIFGFPFLLDPLVMYWNRDMFDAAGIATYPRLWDDFSKLNKSLTSKDSNGNLRKSAVALGQFGNINNAREILGTLLMQAGNPVTAQDATGLVSSKINMANSSGVEAVVRFFSQFVDPASPNFSWNKSMPNSKSAFLSGVLATYFGFASELADIRSKNPNLNFDVALMPSPKSGGTGVTYGRMYGFSLVKTSPNLAADFQIITLLSSAQFLGDFSKSLYLPNVRRDVLVTGSDDPYISLFNNAALVSSTWLDADPNKSNQIFSDMIGAFTSGQKSINQAVQDAGGQYDAILKQAVVQ